jgi:hypothetical protein
MVEELQRHVEELEGLLGRALREAKGLLDDVAEARGIARLLAEASLDGRNPSDNVLNRAMAWQHIPLGNLGRQVPDEDGAL